MLRPAVILSAAAIALALPASADAGSPKRIVSPAYIPPHKVVMVPINPPLSGVFLTSRAVVCPRTGRVQTMYYFNGRWANRPDYFLMDR